MAGRLIRQKSPPIGVLKEILDTRAKSSEVRNFNHLFNRLDGLVAARSNTSSRQQRCGHGVVVGNDGTALLPLFFGFEMDDPIGDGKVLAKERSRHIDS